MSLRQKIEQLRALANSTPFEDERQSALVKADKFEAQLPTPVSQAVLPKQLETQNHLHQMRVGQRGWTVPWAMVADENGLLFLRSGHTFDPHPGGTAQLFVERQNDGYHVIFSRSNYRDYTWDREKNSDGNIPVRTFSTR